ncbi:hypothetical protein [Burkholderia paludis]|uniref:hypothetical protein n=1 Tax=Burkholderia paludis TaxID=1506587 RepID=UPI001F434C86|nr:hypothetical protein [Burkholderia paludis]
MWRWFVDRADTQVRRTVGNAHLALQSIQYLMDGQVPDDPESLFGFEQATLMWLDSVVRREAGDSLNRAGARSASLRMNAEIYLAHHYSDPDLTPDRLVHALNVSRRTLYGALAATSQTPQVDPGISTAGEQTGASGSGRHEPQSAGAGSHVRLFGHDALRMQPRRLPDELSKCIGTGVMRRLRHVQSESARCREYLHALTQRLH